jgi:Protein of unknown function (DUF2585)
LLGRLIVGSTGLLLAMTLVLIVMGRRWWCACGSWDLTSWDIWSSHNSQHLIDPYFFSHVLHGVLFFWFLRAFANRVDRTNRLLLALALEVAWELLENSPIIINRYREATISLDYIGDSIANSWIDVVACAMGYAFAAHTRWWWSIIFFVAIELVLLMAIRDCLALNVLMLAWPIEAIKLWQSPG